MIVENLKNSILFSAMKGLLSERMTSDTDVQNTLNKIKKEKGIYLLNHSNIKNLKLEGIDITEIPFVVPETWKWVRWGNLSNSIQYGANVGALPK